MRRYILIGILLSSTIVVSCSSSKKNNTKDLSQELTEQGYELVWHDEFNEGEKPNTEDWGYEQGFVRNRELQWYQQDNARIEDGRLIIKGRRERVKNPNYQSARTSWKKKREYAAYTSSSINTSGKHSFKYGIFEIRARIDTARGMWPAIWTLGTHPDRSWPANGEIDIMEYYLVDGEPAILANAAWADENHHSVWDDKKIPFHHFLNQDSQWPEKFHIWKMKWTREAIKIYLDDELLNEIDLSKTVNADGFNPFHQPHYILLNLALGATGGDPSQTSFPKQYEVDFVRVYQKNKR